MKNRTKIEDIIGELVKSISDSDLPEGFVDTLEDICKRHDFAPKVVYSYFEEEKDIEVKHLLAITLITFMNKDISLRQFLKDRGWTQEELDDAVEY